MLEPVFTKAGDPFFLVGHFYGASVALVAAMAHPGRMRALAVYEPTLFSLLKEQAPGGEAAQGIRAAAQDAAAAIEAGDAAGAARRFIDYWMGPGSWDLMLPARQGPVAASMVNIRGWASALFGLHTPLEAFRMLDIPVLCMVGARSPASSLGVAKLLAQALPRVRTHEFANLGHMGPVTHPDIVNDEIERFFAHHGLRIGNPTHQGKQITNFGPPGGLRSV